MSEGIVYVLSNPCLRWIDRNNCNKPLLKIGMTKGNLLERVEQLQTTGVPDKFFCEFACRTPYCERVERAMHDAFETSRYALNREFFKTSVNKIVFLLENFGPNVTDQGRY